MQLFKKFVDIFCRGFIYITLRFLETFCPSDTYLANVWPLSLWEDNQSLSSGFGIGLWKFSAVLSIFLREFSGKLDICPIAFILVFLSGI